jgi:hypothetical protein
MTYTITSAIHAAAKKLGVEVKVSTVKGKKLDAFKNGKKIRSFGALGYGDYHVFLREKGKEFAEMKKRAYWSRHQKDANNKFAPDGELSAGYLAAHILW